MGRGALYHSRRAEDHTFVSMVDTPSSILGGNLRFLVDSRYQASTSTWTDTVGGTPMTGQNSPTLAAVPGLFNGQPVFEFNGTNQAFDTGDLGADIVASGGVPYMWVVAQATNNPTGAQRRIASLSLNNGGIHLSLGDTDSDGDVNAYFTGNVSIGNVPSPQAFPSFWEIFYNTGGTRTFFRDGVSVATSAVATIPSAIRRVQIGGLVSGSNNYSPCRVAQLGVCTVVPTAAQRAALRAAAIRDFDVGPKTVAQVLGSNLVFRVDSLTGWSAGAWVDSVGAVSLTGTGTPTRAADGTLYRGKNVINFNGTSQGYSGAAGANLCAAGTRPYVYMVMRQIAGNASACKVLQTHDAGAANENYGIGDTVGAVTAMQARIEGASFGSVALPNAAPSFWEMYLSTAAGVRSFDKDGVSVATNGTGVSTGFPIRTVSIGALINTLQFAQCTVAEAGICTAHPGSSTAAILRAMQREVWNTP